VTTVPTQLDLKSATEMLSASYREILQAPALSPELKEKLAKDTAYLSVVQRDIQQNVRRPISFTEISAIRDFLEMLIGVLSQEVVSSALQAPISASSLAEKGYSLLDQINEGYSEAPDVTLSLFQPAACRQKRMACSRKD
jgi:hypothetical protein